MLLLDRALALSACPELAALAPGAIAALAARATPVGVPDGGPVVVPGEAVLVVAAGAVALADGRRAEVGAVLGLTAALAGVPPDEHGVAAGAVTALAVLRDELLDLIAEDATAVRGLLTALAARLRAAERR